MNSYIDIETFIW